MKRRHKATILGVSVVTVLLLYQFAGAILDTLYNLFNIQVPLWCYGLLSLVFLICSGYMLVKGDGG